MSRKRKKRKSKAMRWGKIIVIEIILLIILIPAAFIYSKLSLINSGTGAHINKDNIMINDDADQESLRGYRNIALFGVDSRDGSLQENTRSDSIIVVSINQETKDIKLASIYRDTCVRVPDYGLTKITHAYAYGGAELAMSTLNTNFDLDITEFVTVDFGVFAEIVDALGGVDIEVTEAEVKQINDLTAEQNANLGTHSTPISGAGMHHLDGTQATSYSRIRKIDSDFQRAERQRVVLSEIFNKAQHADLKTLNKLIDTLLPEIYTNLTKTDILRLAKDVFNYTLVEQTGYPFNKATGSFDGASYVFIDGFSDNLRQLHYYLFGTEDYTPSPTAKSIADEIWYASGY